MDNMEKANRVSLEAMKDLIKVVKVVHTTEQKKNEYLKDLKRVQTNDAKVLNLNKDNTIVFEKELFNAKRSLSGVSGKNKRRRLNMKYRKLQANDVKEEPNVPGDEI